MIWHQSISGSFTQYTYICGTCMVQFTKGHHFLLHKLHSTVFFISLQVFFCYCTSLQEALTRLNVHTSTVEILPSECADPATESTASYHGEEKTPKEIHAIQTYVYHNEQPHSGKCSLYFWNHHRHPIRGHRRSHKLHQNQSSSLQKLSDCSQNGSRLMERTSRESVIYA